MKNISFMTKLAVITLFLCDKAHSYEGFIARYSVVNDGTNTIAILRLDPNGSYQNSYCLSVHPVTGQTAPRSDVYIVEYTPTSVYTEAWYENTVTDGGYDENDAFLEKSIRASKKLSNVAFTASLLRKRVLIECAHSDVHSYSNRYVYTISIID